MRAPVQTGQLKITAQGLARAQVRVQLASVQPLSARPANNHYCCMTTIVWSIALQVHMNNQVLVFHVLMRIVLIVILMSVLSAQLHIICRMGLVRLPAPKVPSTSTVSARYVQMDVVPV